MTDDEQWRAVRAQLGRVLLLSVAAIAAVYLMVYLTGKGIS